jgi:ribA/ribD-fused uncharacterized protein
MEKFIFFWNGIYSQWLSSFFTIDGVQYSSCEQYMMAKKALYFKDRYSYLKIMQSSDPREQKNLGRKVINFDSKKWNLVCRDIVYEGNYAKFTQNPHLKEQLLQTGDKELVEASPYDTIWGIGLSENDPNILDKTKWKGTNWLGEAIMKVRETLRSESNGIKIHRYHTFNTLEDELTKPSVFLAGPTVRGNQPTLTSWRFEAIEEFKRQGFDGELILPEFSSKTESDKDKDWVPIWEYNGLKKADCILFWVPRTRDLIGLTTNMEFGYWQAREPEKMIYGRPSDAFRIGYLDIMWKAVANDGFGYSPNIYDNLVETVSESIKLAKNRFEQKSK